MFAQEPHRALKIACSRYGSAVVRWTAEDRLIDAIVGLESILLCDANVELSFRLALRYAMLVAQTSDDRKYAFRTMKGLYKARNSVVHGADVEGVFSVGGQKLPLGEVASKAQDTLREVILAFLPDVAPPRFTREGFWEDQLFGKSRPRD